MNTAATGGLFGEKDRTHTSKQKPPIRATLAALISADLKPRIYKSFTATRLIVARDTSFLTNTFETTWKYVISIYQILA